jgi:hypothetical protein
MNDSQNIQIPLSLFRKITGVFDYLLFSNTNIPVILDFDTIIFELRVKQHKINLRTAYTNTVIAKDGEQKRLAYASYLNLKKRVYRS